MEIWFAKDEDIKNTRQIIVACFRDMNGGKSSTMAFL